MRAIRADGDRWTVRLGERPPSPDVQHVVFFCQTADQRPYRVVEVPRDRIPDADALAKLSDQELIELFGTSRSMDFPRSWPSYGP